MYCQSFRKLYLSILMVGLLIFAGCGQDPVSMVKEGKLERDKSTTIGSAIDNYRYFYNVNWVSEETDNGRCVVRAVCPVSISAMTVGDLSARYFASLGMQPENADDPSMAQVVGERIPSATAVFEFVVNTDATFELKNAALQFVSGSGEEASLPWDDQALEQSLTDIYENRLALGFLALMPVALEENR